MLAPLASLAPVSMFVRRELVHRVLGAAVNGVSEGSRRNALAALEAREAHTRHGTEVVAALPREEVVALPRQA